MSYEPAITDEASEDLHKLLDSLPSARRREALDAVEAALLRFATNPRLGQGHYLGRRAYYFSFVAGGVHYHWGCAFVLSEDEKSMGITHIFRTAL